MATSSTATSIPPPPETNWFHNAGRGVFTHYLNGLQNNKGPNSLGRNTSWSDTVDEFDVDAYADSAARAGARYAVITMMQGGIHMIAPNSRYDNYTGYAPGVACARRDLVLDLHAALAKRDLRLLLYWTGDGPHMDHQASAGLGMPNCPTTDPKACDCRLGCPDKPGNGVPLLFAQRWADVLAEYAQRYGDKVSGWWIDGCYAPWYNQTGFPRQSKLAPYHAAIRSGKPASATP